MWFGTDNGLARFDGRQIQNFTFGDAEANRVLSLNTSLAGQLWIGTHKGGFVYSGDRIKPIAGTEGMGITSILSDDDTLIGTDTGIVLRIRANENGEFSSETLLAKPISIADGTAVGVTSLIRRDGKILIGTSGSGTIELVDGNVSELQMSPRPLFVNALGSDSSHKLWFGIDASKGISGIYSMTDGSQPERIVAPTAKVAALESNESGLWAGTERYGLFRVVGSKTPKAYTFENTSGGLRSDNIFALFTDREGILWVGTNRGVSRFDPTGPIQQTVSDIPNSNFVRTFFRSGDGKNLFAGSNRGLFRLDGESWNLVPTFRDKVIYAIGTRKGSMAVGTATGTFDPAGKPIAGGDTRSLEMFRGNTYAAVYGKGVIDITGDIPSLIFPDESVCSLLIASDKLWIGTAGNGIFSFDGQGVKVEAGPDTLKSGTVRKMIESDDHRIWIAGEHGVFVYKDGKSEQIIAAEDVRDVYVDGANVWAATTTRGLLHCRLDERLGWLVSSIGFEQGLPSDKAFAIMPLADRQLLIGTNRGVATYIPGSVAPKIIPIRVLGSRLHDTGEIRSTIPLEYPQNSLLVEVAGLSSRTFPEEFQYAVLLKNRRGEVIDSRFSYQPQYSAADLSPGEYSIESYAYDRDLLVSEPLIVRFSIAKAPFPWTATALGVLLIIALIALIWAIIERRHISQRNRELAAARSDLANEAERERSRIARDLHDQTLADLRNLMMMSDRLSPANPEFRGEIESVSTEIRRICEDLSPSVLENVGLVPALEFLLGRSVENHSFSTTEDANELVTFPVIVQLHIYRIAQEVLTNIKRHSDATIVKMNVEAFVDGRFQLRICDNGKTFKPNGSIGVGRGISNIRSRAGIINAAIAWEEPADGGNVFSLEIAGTSGV